MPVTFGSLASGLPPDIVEKLVEVERRPIQMMELSKADLENKQKLLKDLKGRINGIPVTSMKDIYGFREMKSVSSDETVVRANVDKALARPATYNIEVVNLARRSSAISTGFPDKDKSQVGVGYVTFKTSTGESKDIFIGPYNNSLNDVAKAINDSGLGFVANVIEDGTDTDKPYRLLISGQSSGDSEAVEWPQFYFLDGDYDFYIDQERPAQDAKVKIDGFEIEVPENKVKEMLPGVTIDLLKANPGQEVNLTIMEDIESISAKVKGLVDSINKVLEFIQAQNSLNAESNTRNTLGGDITLSTIENRIRSIFTRAVPGAGFNLKYLSEVGIGFQRNGLLAFDENKFNAAINEHFGDVARLFVGTGDMQTGVVPVLDRELKAFTNVGTGILTSREEGIKRRMDSLDQSIERKEVSVAKKAEQLKSTFAKLESAMASMKTQSAYVSQALGAGQTGGILGNMNLGTAKVA
ncbi:MAG: flagellar filament capping protein FliD [Oligoflexia bacterium]|nr:flagellar filament capping protein FliD [Oligoflexia bacterium]